MEKITRNDDGAISEIGFCDWKRRELRDKERHDGHLQYRYLRGLMARGEVWGGSAYMAMTRRLTGFFCLPELTQRDSYPPGVKT